MDNQRAMDDVCYDEVVHFVKRGHQVLVSFCSFLNRASRSDVLHRCLLTNFLNCCFQVFVHARNATAKLAMAFRERAAALHHLDTFQDVDKCKRSYAMMEKSVGSKPEG